MSRSSLPSGSKSPLERCGVHQNETPNRLDMTHRISFGSYHQRGEARVTMLSLRLTTRNFTRMKHTPQVGGSSPNAPMLQDRGTHHNLIGGSRQSLRSSQSSEGPQALRVQMKTKSSKPPLTNQGGNQISLEEV